MSITTITLPSEGRFYQDRIPGGEVTLNPMRASEEAVLFSEGSSSSKKLDTVLRRLLVDCPLKPEELLLADRAYLLIILRTQAHGADYRVPFRCEFCSKQTEVRLNIAEALSLKEIPDNLANVTEPVPMTLPKSGDQIEAVFLRGTHEAQISQFARRTGKKGSYKEESAEYLYRLALQIQTVNGNDLTIPERLRYVRSLLSADSNFFKQFMDQAEPGLDFEIFVECQLCFAENKMVFPYNEEFFRPKLGVLG